MTEDKHRNCQDKLEPTELVEDDRSAKFAYDLATTLPTKDVAAVKAASDIFDANPDVKSARRRETVDKSR